MANEYEDDAPPHNGPCAGDECVVTDATHPQHMEKCKVESVREDGTLNVVSCDGKHSFSCSTDQVVPHGKPKAQRAQEDAEAAAEAKEKAKARKLAMDELLRQQRLEREELEREYA